MKAMKELRKLKKLTQTDVANGVGITFQTYSSYETDNTKPTPEMLCKLADFFGVTVDELLGRSPAPAMFDDARTSVHPVLDMYNRLTPHQQELIIERMQGFIDGNQERQKLERENKSQAVQYFTIQNRQNKTE